ncbi:hypothetical protein K466DRAFT_606841 [Polyporus arcularius HHB13444]|uniref:Uncharacterized protein n=1 Tax=Polyporus arcularius HHB13444 TaxID=1314778 RepID=A0A5C3NN00_9APHY|nr:hypothetical protein K466DRAFT_606841 [Polyporus arcularius HHB13444]
MSFSRYPPSLLAQHFPTLDIARAAQEMDRLLQTPPLQPSSWTDEELDDLTAWRYHEARRREEMQASMPSNPDDDDAEPEQLNEVLSTAHEGGVNYWLPADPLQPTPPTGEIAHDGGWGAPTGGGWGAPSPTGSWGSPEDLPFEGMGLVRLHGAAPAPGQPTPRFAIRFTGYAIATKDAPQWDQMDELVVDWPAGPLEAGSWPPAPGGWHLSVYSLPFRARDIYAELKRVFVFFNKAHPLEDAEWLQDRWDSITEAIATHTAAPISVPEEALLAVAEFWREILLGDAWQGPEFELWG